MERGVGERRAELAGQNPRDGADVAHADADGGHLAAAHELEHPQVVVRMVAIVENLTMSGSSSLSRPVQLFEVVGRLAKVVQADDPLGAAETGIERAMSSSRSTYSTPSAMAARKSSSRCSSVP